MRSEALAGGHREGAHDVPTGGWGRSKEACHRRTLDTPAFAPRACLPINTA